MGGQAKESGDSVKVKIRMRQAAKAERREERTPGSKAPARKEEKGKMSAAREKPERVGRAARQDTL